MKIKNPILKGFHPDPCIICVEDTFYIATSTFEYFPGVNFYQSKDLVHWEQIDSPLNTEELLDMRSQVASSGVWAPDLTYADGRFYLVYSNMSHVQSGPFKDGSNYIVTASKIQGPWSFPHYFNSSGFDASLFHDKNGKSYFVNMEWNFTKGGSKPSFTGILLQEIDRKTLEKKGPVKRIFTGSEWGFTEGPHLYQKDGYYYLFCAEGGTGFRHAEIVARSRQVDGPYEIHPNTHLLHSHEGLSLQRTGHASLVDGKENGWLIAYLCGRKNSSGKCILGRETALQNIVWKDDWPYLADGTDCASETFFLVKETEIHPENPLTQYAVDSEKFARDFKTLRMPMDRFRRIEKDRIILEGKESLHSEYMQNALFRPQTELNCSFQLHLKYEPNGYQEWAGMTYRYQESNFFAFYSTFDEQLQQKVLCLMISEDYRVTYDPQVVSIGCEVDLKCRVMDNKVRFYYSTDGKNEIPFGEEYSNDFLTDDAIQGGFTGAHFGFFACDLAFHRKEAEFSKICYQNEDDI